MTYRMKSSVARIVGVTESLTWYVNLYVPGAFSPKLISGTTMFAGAAGTSRYTLLPAPTMVSSVVVP